MCALNIQLENCSFYNQFSVNKKIFFTIIKMNKVVILKSESESSDAYATLLKENNFEALFVPTLEFRFKNLDLLSKKLEEPDNFSGIIFTSPRAVEACEQAVKSTHFDKKWKDLYNYCVGDVTHNVIHTALDMNARGKQTGNANNLAEFIFDNLEGERLTLPFLFPCGNLRQDTMQLKLLEFGYFLEAVEVYETVAHSELEQNLRKALIDDNAEYLAFFSPSGVTHTKAALAKMDIDLNNYKLIAIGASTRKCLESNDLKVYKTAERPSVEYLVKALIGGDIPA